MKLIRAIVRPEKALELKDLLSGSGYHGISTTDCHGYGESKKIVKQVYRGKVYEQRADAVKRIEVELVVPDDKVDNVIRTIRNVAVTNHGADGRIYVFGMSDSVHIHSGGKHMGDYSEKELKDEF
ncbi:nitrogen regulatory protein P-II [Candidatus Scalindua japonica]|uniref:Nitrogen regulatory protein P-II n=1 Tax=Candidatus Scalindua japonica TaxID=1284222 RepID=A0A286TU44_9BACT|nr:P-II family nitrogen regulator [Candidatus Scalindua japonica]GAX59420.1 nitrogen regulatory protein P-II [Candidatus Scalindua japonica]